ncbi:MAG: aminotransferase class I/II-fold pyridoxal phosphate-dependent enzyme [Erysipelotrichaceae bacterium]|nr:aminotransferase class I/II-fold pyridoxal phosphate-dependent enzyme [Erysipelotrichaceae bacterium]MDD4641987.1 aminotransferase class I/II-fold pyridoxal phosphate-dependent enzyme [Erysipelotrichaceae bacterium]
MKFIKSNSNATPLQDNVFMISDKAQAASALNGNDKIINATIGSLYDEDETIATFDCVYDTYANIDSKIKAKYAQAICGNPNFLKSVYDWVFDKVELNLKHRSVATPGGTGAIALAMMNVLDENMKVLIPDLAWSSYKLMAKNNNLEVVNYQMFDNDRFNIKSLTKQAESIMIEQGKLLLFINDPSHNPSGYSMSLSEWQEVIDLINRLSLIGPCILVNDIAYIDYCKDIEHSRDYMRYFNNISDNVALIVAFSCSKTFTSYGMRLGVAILLAKQLKTIQTLYDAFENSARAIWSNVNNGWMENFTTVMTDKKEIFIKEKQKYIEMLKQRSDTFCFEANDCQLPIYPHKEGFFVTIKILDKDILGLFHERLMNNHIYTVKLDKGIRVAICSVPLKKIKGLAYKMKQILDQTKKK